MNSAACMTVLVAEDETLIRMIAADVLADAGYNVIEAADAEEALVALHARSAAIALLFTDIHMPGAMNGLALAHHVRGHWPHIGLLIASGEARPLPHALPVGSIFLAKPYDLDHVTTHAHALTGRLQ